MKRHQIIDFKGTKGNMRLMDVIDASIQYDEIHILTTEGVFKMKGDEGTWTQIPLKKSFHFTSEYEHFPKCTVHLHRVGRVSNEFIGTPCDIQWLGSKQRVHFKVT